MKFDSYSLEESETEVKAMTCRPSTGTRRLPPGIEDDSKKRRYSPLYEPRPAKRQKNIKTKMYTSTAGSDSLSIASSELEFEIEMARFEILNHFRNMKIQMENNDKVIDKEMEIWSQGSLENINGGESLQNEFFIKSLIDNFEQVIRNIGQESKRDVNHIMDDIRKILVKLVKRIERDFRPRPNVDAVKVTRTKPANFLWIGLWSLIAVLIVVFPDYRLKFFESAVAFYQSTSLMSFLPIFLFCMLYFYSPSSK